MQMLHIMDNELRRIVITLFKNEADLFDKSLLILP